MRKRKLDVGTNVSGCHRLAPREALPLDQLALDQLAGLFIPQSHVPRVDDQSAITRRGISDACPQAIHA